MDVKDIIGEEWSNFLPKAEELLEPIQEQIVLEKSYGYTILPERKLIFRTLKETKPSEVKVLLLGQDPYHNPEGQSTGRAFECGRYPSSSWRKIIEVYKDQVNPPDEKVMDGILDKWASQGVFLFNKALTVRHRVPNSHTRIWEPFTKYVISSLLTDLSPKAVIILGQEAQKMVGRIHAPHAGFVYEHPAAASYQNRKWNAPNIFKDVAQFVEFHHEVKINW